MQKNNTPSIYPKLRFTFKPEASRDKKKLKKVGEGKKVKIF